MVTHAAILSSIPLIDHGRLGHRANLESSSTRHTRRSWMRTSRCDLPASNPSVDPGRATYPSANLPGWLDAPEVHVSMQCASSGASSERPVAPVRLSDSYAVSPLMTR